MAQRKHQIDSSIPIPGPADEFNSSSMMMIHSDSVLARPHSHEPLTKKKRVTRACDECRRKKVKCDGQQPCIHCTVYSYECTYNQPSARRRQQPPGNATPQQAQAQTHLHHVAGSESNLARQYHHQAPTALHGPVQQPKPHHETLDITNLQKKLQQYEQFVDRLLPDLHGPNIWKLNGVIRQMAGHGHDPNGKISLSEVTQLYHLTSSTAVNTGLSPNSSSNTGTPQQAAIDGSFESHIGKEIKIILPPKDIAVKLISSTWDNTCVLFRFYHRPSFIKQLSILYETDPMNYTDTQQKFLPLVYSVMACGSLFYKSSELTRNSMGQAKDEHEIFDDEGYRYFIAARKLIDITDTRDIYGIQTIVMLVLFLQCGARLSTCYSYVGIGLRAALREGFHRRLNFPFDPIQLEVRKRIFWTMYKMDIYVNAMLGLPMSLDEEDFDQEFPIELDDENITETGYNWSNQKALSSSAIANSHTKLLLIMKKVVQQLYPVNRQNKTGPPPSSNNIVYNLELELQNWVNDLPLELKPGIEPNQRYFKANRLLHFSYLHIKIILYRPFIHYISQDSKSSKNIDELKAIEKAKNCINVARIVVKLSQDMIAKNMLSGSYWFSVYTIFFSVACLVYYVHFGPGVVDDEYMAIKADAEAGKKVLEVLKNSTTAARRTFDILNSVFEQMNRNTAQKSPANASSTTTAQQVAVAEASTTTGKVNTDVKVENEAINGIVNGVNFIDGKDTGISLNMSIPTPSRKDDEDNRFEPPHASSATPPATAGKVPTPLTSTSNLQSPAISMDQQDGLASSVDTAGNIQSNTNNTDDKYLPGIIDKFDEQIFGKFLPPYMNSQFNQLSHELVNGLLNGDGEFQLALPSGLGNNSAPSAATAAMPASSAQDAAASTTPAQETSSISAESLPFDTNLNNVETNSYNFDELLNEWAHDTNPDSVS